MIYFTKNIKDFKIYINEIIWFSCKLLIITGMICIPLIIYFFLVGFIFDKEALTFAYGILFVFINILIILIRISLCHKKNLLFLFKKANSNGDIESSIRLENDEFVIENISQKTTSRIDKSYVKSIIITKKIIFVKLSLGNFLFFPKTDELVEFFEQNINIDK